MLSWLLDLWMIPSDIYVLTKSFESSDILNKEYGINIWIAKDADIIILATKPQNFDEVDLTCFSQNALIVSVMAGVKISKIQLKTPSKNIVRMMPNLWLAVKKWVTGYYYPANIIDEKFEYISTLFSSLWKFIELSDEDQVNKITALSWSGPAYFYLLAECMVDKAFEMGFDKETARDIVVNTFLSSAMLADKWDHDLATLRENITSKGGTTHQAITSFISDNLPQIISRWIQKAYQRAIELSL